MSFTGLPYQWTSGAIWLLPRGVILRIPGFHDEWIREHQDMVPGCANACEVVIKQGWVSVVTYADQYIELMIPDRRQDEVIERVLTYLGLNLEHWRNALVMTMDEEGYFKLAAEDFDDPQGLRKRLMADTPPGET